MKKSKLSISPLVKALKKHGLVKKTGGWGDHGTRGTAGYRGRVYFYGEGDYIIERARRSQWADVDYAYANPNYAETKQRIIDALEAEGIEYVDTYTLRVDISQFSK